MEARIRRPVRKSVRCKPYGESVLASLPSFLVETVSASRIIEKRARSNASRLVMVAALVAEDTPLRARATVLQSRALRRQGARRCQLRVSRRRHPQTTRAYYS